MLAITADAPAKAYIDDRQYSAPVPIDSLVLDPGIHRVRVLFTETDTYSSTQWVTIRAGKTTRVHFDLEL